MGMWRDSIIFKRTRLCNCIAFPVGSEVGIATSVRGLDRLSYSGVLFVAARVNDLETGAHII